MMQAMIKSVVIATLKQVAPSAVTPYIWQATISFVLILTSQSCWGGFACINAWFNIVASAR